MSEAYIHRSYMEDAEFSLSVTGQIVKRARRGKSSRLSLLAGASETKAAAEVAKAQETARLEARKLRRTIQQRRRRAAAREKAAALEAEKKKQAEAAIRKEAEENQSAYVKVSLRGFCIRLDSLFVRVFCL